jgi:hypothetical protein
MRAFEIKAANIWYRSLRGYKYALKHRYTMDLLPLKSLERTVGNDYFTLCRDGTLTIEPGYAWDGPSWASDTPNFMRASLIHDVLYQAMRMGLIDDAIWRPIADQLLHDICIVDGMSRFRAWCVWWAVRTFAKRCAAPTGKAERSDIVLVAPGRATTGATPCEGAKV